MTQCVRCRGGWQTERDAGPGHRLLHHALAERAALGAPEQRLLAGERVRAELRVIGHGRADDGEQRHHALLAALAGDGQRLAQRQIGGDERERLGDAQAGAVHQQQHRPVARADPVSACERGDTVGQIGGLVGRDRARQALFDPRPAQAGRGSFGMACLLTGEGDETLECRKLAGGRDVADPFGPARGELRAQGGRIEIGDIAPVLRIDLLGQPARRGKIGAHRMRRAPARAGEIIAPLLEQRRLAHAATSAAGTSSPSSASSNGMPCGVTPIRSPSRQARPRLS